jgi:putative transposase
MRRSREEEPGAYYHVTTRGNDRQPIVDDGVDCAMWERLLARVVRECSWEVLAFCLLTNHFHLLLRLPLGELSDGMRELNGVYARQFNQRHRRSNHLFGRRFWSTRITTRAHLLASARYSDWNPVRCGLAAAPADYRWSSHAAVAGLVHSPSFLAVGALLGLFSPDPAAGRAAYLEWVAAGQGTVPGVTVR